MHPDLVFRSAAVFDGTGADPQIMDIGITEDRI